jgi:predicted Zn-dependent protease
MRSGAGRGAFDSPAALAAQAERAARSALRLEPGRASNYQRLGSALAARAQLARAIERERGPDAGAEASGPLAIEADAAFAEAERRAPADALILTDHVTADLALGRADLALANARRIVALYPEAATGHALEAGALLELGRNDEARVALERARDGRWEAEDAERRAIVERLLEQLQGGTDAP